MTDFKVGDVVRVVKRPKDTWTPEMFIGREFMVTKVENVWGYGDAVHCIKAYWIPVDCIELATPKTTDGWQPWNPPSEDPPPRVRPARSRRALDAKFGPRAVDEWDV